MNNVFLLIISICNTEHQSPTLQSLHAVQLGEKLVDDAVGDPRAVVAPPGGQRVELIEEQDARLGGLSPEMNRQRREKKFHPTPANRLFNGVHKHR